MATLTNQQIEAIKPKSAEEVLNNFYFLIFSPNPTKNIVRVIIDDGSIKLWMNIDKFVQIIKIVVSPEMAQAVKAACVTYGCYFMIDRPYNKIRKLNITSEKNIINLKSIHDDIEYAKKNNKKDEALRKRFIATLDNNILDKIKPQNTNKTSFINDFSSTIIYNNYKNNTYRPY